MNRRGFLKFMSAAALAVPPSVSLKTALAEAIESGLDAYEEGFFTPTLEMVEGGVSYQSAIGHYTRIGKTVFVTAKIDTRPYAGTLPWDEFSGYLYPDSTAV